MNVVKNMLGKRSPEIYCSRCDGDGLDENMKTCSKCNGSGVEGYRN